MTLGETRVRVEFNPSKTGLVDQIKQKSAELINLINDLKVDNPNSEFARLKALAMTTYEEAAMWGVKTATFGL